MKKLFLLFGLCAISLINVNINAQDLKTEVYVKEHTPNKKPVPYVPVREGDVMWSKIIYRLIDLRERMNYPLYYPLEPIGNRMNLIDVIMLGVDEYKLTAYDAMDERNEFKIPLTPASIDKLLGADTMVVDIMQPDGSVLKESTVSDRRTDQVKQIMIKEKWYFDRNYSIMKSRIIGVCPIRVFNKIVDGSETDEIVRQKCFWIYYPEFRGMFATHEIFNNNNDAQRISYDDLFWQRRFKSIIVKESNPYDNRSISNYASGLETLYESERIKNWLFNFEHDLWEY